MDNRPTLTKISAVDYLPPKVSYREFSAANVQVGNAEQKTSKGPTPAQYHSASIKYAYGRGSDDFLLEGCPMRSFSGLTSKPGLNGKPEHSMLTKFDLTSADQRAFLAKIDELFEHCADVIDKQIMAGIVKLPNFMREIAANTGFKHPINYPIDPRTKKRRTDVSPSVFWKLFRDEKSGRCTTFTKLNGKQASWDELRDADITFVPLIRVKSIYFGGGKASVQIEMVSAIVIRCPKNGTVSPQIDTLLRLQQEYPQEVEGLRDEGGDGDVDGDGQHSPALDEPASLAIHPLPAAIPPLGSSSMSDILARAPSKPASPGAAAYPPGLPASPTLKFN